MKNSHQTSVHVQSKRPSVHATHATMHPSVLIERLSTVGGLFAVNTSESNISYHQQTGSLFNTYPQAAPPTERCDHYPNDDEDCVGGFSFGNNKPTSLTFAAAKPTTTSHLFSQSRRPRLVEESFGWSTPQTVPFNQEDCEKSTRDSPSQVLPNPKLRTGDITQTGAGEQ